MWTENARPTSYGQWLAWQITTEHSIDPADEVEPVTKLAFSNPLEPKVIIKKKKEAIENGKEKKELSDRSQATRHHFFFFFKFGGRGRRMSVITIRLLFRR